MVHVYIIQVDLLTKLKLRQLVEHFESLPGIDAVIPISALKAKGLKEVEEWAVSHLPEGPALYPKVCEQPGNCSDVPVESSLFAIKIRNGGESLQQDAVSEHPERFFVGEIVREKIFQLYRDEIPYCTTASTVLPLCHIFHHLN